MRSLCSIVPLLIAASLTLSGCGEIPDDCSAAHCPPASKYCQGVVADGAGDISYQCVYYPETCDEDRTCGCLQGAGLPDACRESDIECGELGNGVTVLTCQ